MNYTRGSVIKTPDNAPGLLFIDGQQKSFVLAGVWHSAVAPAVNMTVDVKLDETGNVTSISAVDPHRLAREKLDRMSAVAQTQGKQATEMARQWLTLLIARTGRLTFGCTLALWIGWFFLPFYSFAVNVFGARVVRSFTFWECLGIYTPPGTIPSAVNPDGTLGSTHGLASLLGIAAIAVPWIVPFLRHPRARLLNAAPLAYLALWYLNTLWDAHRAAQMAAVAAQNNPMFGIFAGMVKDAIQASTYEYGMFVLVAASAVLGIRTLTGK